VGREGIEPPQSKTADLQSAELTTCSTYPRLRSTGGALPTEREYTERRIGASTERSALSLHNELAHAPFLSVRIPASGNRRFAQTTHEE
jgi:hypothetical protein